MRVHEILAMRRQRALDIRNQRVARFFAAHPAIQALDEERLRRSRALIGQMLVAKPESLKEAREALDQVIRQEDAAKEKAGVDAAFFEPEWTCRDCHDEGFIDGISCHCRNALLLEERMKKSAVAQRIDRENFETFDLSLFRKDRQRGEDRSPFENMKEIKTQLEKDYVPYFSSTGAKSSPNLFFYGPTGTGKTFLLNALVKAILDRGFSVLYQSAPELLDFLVTFSFSYANERTPEEIERKRFIFESDLLVIDDLGTEFGTEKSVAELFELINTRIVASRPTIISSNLKPTELTAFYNTRIASRIAGEYLMMELYGADLRR